MSPLARSEPLQARALLRPYALVYLYRRRLRVHRAQELLAGVGVTIAVALVFAAMIANGSIAGSATEVVRAVIGPANLQLHARNADGLDERLLRRVQRLPGVAQAAPLLEQTATLVGPNGRTATVDIAGTDVTLAMLNGLAHTIPLAAFSPGGIGLSKTSAEELGASASDSARGKVLLQLRGEGHWLEVAAVLGREAAGGLSQARIAVMPLNILQRLSGLRGRLSRILIRSAHGQEAAVRAELLRIAGGRLTVARADADVSLLRQALRPSDQASGFFAAISALLGFLFAFNAMLLTVPERRQAIADLRLIGTKRAAILQIVAFQALCLGLAASLVGLLVGYILSLGVFHQSSGYLAEAFTLGTRTVFDTRSLLLSLFGGIVATFLASAVPLIDLRRGRALDAVYFEDGAPGNALSRRVQVRLAVGATCLLALTTGLFEIEPSLALVATGVLAMATVFLVPLAFSAVLLLAHVIATRYQRLTILQVAITSLKAATLRSLALAATGAVAIFGGIALGGARNDLLRGIDRFSHSYAADAQLWVANAGDNQATLPFNPGPDAQRIAALPGVKSVNAFQGGFLEIGDRRVWIIARPPGLNRQVLNTQMITGNAGVAARRLGESGWIAISQQIADEYHVAVGDLLTLPTPSGDVGFRIAATTTNLAWSPGVIFIGSADYRRFWDTTAPTALAVALTPGTDANAVRTAIVRTLGPNSALAVSTAPTREQRIDALTSEGLGRLGEISTLLIVAAILAMAAALGSSVWQRRVSLAGLRLAGVNATRLRRILLTESTLMLSAGCATGAVAGIYGQIIIDGYLKHVTGFPVASLAGSLRPLVVLSLVIAVVLTIVSAFVWPASRVSPTLALDE
ncbi:MAG TPA: FtsX-like permease family protein [Solirubrobacteraceae bacterium]|nr:FtsX-like permease family protein [Solirubrobacteraceae bacterium]